MEVSRIIHQGPMPMEDYLAIDAMSSSQLKTIYDCPARTLANRSEKAHFDLGTLCHEAVLEPHVLDKYVVAPDVKLNTKVGKLEWGKWIADMQKEGKFNRKLSEDDCFQVKRDELKELLIPSIQIVDPAHLAVARGVQRSLTMARHRVIFDLYEESADGNVEYVFLVEVTNTSIGPLNKPMRVKIRLDYWDEENATIIDSKTVNGASNTCDRRSFERSCQTYDYPIQGALYCDVLEALGFGRQDWLWHVMEMRMPYLMAIYRLSEDDRAEGRWRYETALHAMANMAHAGPESLPGYCPQSVEGIADLHVYWKPDRPTVTEKAVVDIPEFDPLDL